jgi:hypothetical protein
MTVASLRNKATLEACLGHATDRNRYMAGALAAIEAALDNGMTGATLAAEIRGEIEAMRAHCANARQSFERLGAKIDAAKYPDEEE